ncbi:hypothetical protein V6N13_077473 [Hibiscus sabdariffa]
MSLGEYRMMNIFVFDTNLKCSLFIRSFIEYGVVHRIEFITGYELKQTRLDYSCAFFSHQFQHLHFLVCLLEVHFFPLALLRRTDKRAFVMLRRWLTGQMIRLSSG